MDKTTKKSNEVLIMRISVIIIALAIFLFWLFNLKNIWRVDNQNNVNNIEEIKEIINEPVGDLNLEDDFKDDAGELLDDLMNNVKEKVSTTSEIKNSNCPEWINCMPTSDGGARSCQVPPGCEGITQIAY